jgi:iron complex outermembrane receptor protein
MQRINGAWRAGLVALLSLASALSAAQAQEMAPLQESDSELSTIPVEQLAPEPAAAGPEDDDGAVRLSDVVVTANYRKQGVQDVVGSAQAFDGGALDKAGVGGMQDYLLQVPSVSLQPSGNGKMNIAIRGVSNINATDLGFNSGSPTVGVYLDDVAIQGSGVFPDLKIFDLDRIEVLKGPQGTLYGEGAMGGAIKMVTMPVDYNNWQFRTEGMYSVTADGAPSHEFRGAVNVPLIDDTLGARLVGTRRHDGGFVDYTEYKPDANTIDADSLRGILSYEPNDWLSLGYMYLYNKDAREQFPVVDKGRQDDMVNTGPEHQFANTRFTIHSLTATLDLPFATVSSITALYDTFRETQRRVPFLQTLVQTQFTVQGQGDAPVLFPNAPSYFTTDLGSFSQELRLVSKGEHAVDWIAGAFYRKRGQDFQLLQYENTLPEPALLETLFGALNLNSFNLLSHLQEDSRGAEKFNQLSAYGEVTWNIVPEDLELTAGLRYFREVFDYSNITDYYGALGVVIATDPSNIHDGTTRNSVFARVPTDGLLPKLSLGWHMAREDLVYATLSRGYRSAAPNTQAAFGNGPVVVQPDYVWNAELGYKGKWLDGSLVTNWAVFDIEWEAIQGTLIGQTMLGAVPADFPYLGNAGDARVFGAEQSTTWAPTSFMTLTLNLGYNHGILTKPDETSVAVANSILPNTPRYNGAATVAFFAPLFGAWLGDASATYSYVARQNTTFTVHGEDTFGRETQTTGTPIPAYGLLKGNVAVSLGAFRAMLFGDNLLNQHSIVAVSAPIDQYTIVAPCTLGLRLSYDF